jgi:hypothetical protein
MNELELQKKIKLILNDPSKVWILKDGKEIQVLSSGLINKFEGPDFKGVALLIGGNIVVGDAEYDIESSYWHLHGHQGNTNFQNTILHIVSEYSDTSNSGIRTLVIPKIQLEIAKDKTEQAIDTDSIEELQHFALIRLLRKSSHAQEIINEHGIQLGFQEITRQFIDRFNSRRRRPVYTNAQLLEFINRIPRSNAFKLLTKIANEVDFQIIAELEELQKEKISEEGSAFRKEILLNCVLPMAICLANVNHRISLLHWYWSSKSLNVYGSLTKRFPDISQYYLWQQQGMLEYISNQGRRNSEVEMSISEMGFSSLLHFYKIGK